MKKREFYLAALKADTYRVTAWNIACFGLLAEGADEWKKNPYPYRVVQLPNAYHYVNPENTDELLVIEDGIVGKPLFARGEMIIVNVGDLDNVYEKATTTYGNVLANQLLLVQAFGRKIPFISGRFNIKKIEAEIEGRIAVRPPNYGEADLAKDMTDPPAAPLYIDEYINFCNGAFSLVAYTQLFTPADTKKTMTRPPGINELRTKLVAENKGQLHDRAVVAKISEALQAADAEYLKGDRGLDFLTSEKSKKIVRSRLFLMYGAESGIEERVDVDLIERSLTEGWDINAMPSMINALRAGSFNRGKQTELGGEAVKDLFRASGNLKISSKDCGSNIGIPAYFTEKDTQRLIGFSVIEGKKSIRVTKENFTEYLHKPLRMRSPMTCLVSHTDFCEECLGERLANNPTGLSMAVADYGSQFLLLFLSAAHSKGIQVAKLNIHEQLL